MTDFSVIGKRVPRIDALEKATGAVCYIEDLELPRMLHGKILWSSHAYARIVNIDTSRAEQLPCVKAVITGKDIAMSNPPTVLLPLFRIPNFRYEDSEPIPTNLSEGQCAGMAANSSASPTVARSI